MQKYHICNEILSPSLKLPYPPKMDGWKMLEDFTFLLGCHIFGSYVSFREGNIHGTLGRELHTPAPMVNDWSSMELSTKHAAHTTTLSKPHLELLICPAIGWRLIHLPKSQQMNILWHPWGHLDLRNCCHRTVYFIELNTVRRQQFRRSRWAQGCKADSGHRLFIYYPKWRLIHLPKSQLAANAPCVSMCGLNLLHIPYPRSRRIHLPRSQQMRAAWLSPPKPALPQVTTDPPAKIAANARCVAWISCTRADFEPQNCRRQILYYPRWRLRYLHETTRKKPVLLLQLVA